MITSMLITYWYWHSH